MQFRAANEAVHHETSQCKSMELVSIPYKDLQIDGSKIKETSGKPGLTYLVLGTRLCIHRQSPIFLLLAKNFF